MPPRALLAALIGLAAGIGGIVHGRHGQAVSRGGESTETKQKLAAAQKEIDLLKRENSSLRSLAQGGGEVPVPAEMISGIEAELGLRFLSSPIVHRIAAEELRDRAAASLESRLGPSGADDRQEACRLIGWLGADDNLISQTTAALTAGTRGWFDEISGEAWVTDRFDAEAVPDKAAMLRLITRILLHQNFPPPAGYLGDDAARAREALHQGAALGAEARFLAAQARAGFLGMNEDEEARLLLESLAPFIRDMQEFPSAAGKAYADELHLQGNEKLTAALRIPPENTFSIAARKMFPTAAQELPEFKESPYLEESAGWLGVKILLGESIANGWKSDRYALVPDGEASATLRWDIAFSDPASADAAEIALKKHAAKLPADGRFISVRRPAPATVRFINAATPDFR